MLIIRDSSFKFRVSRYELRGVNLNTLKFEPRNPQHVTRNPNIKERLAISDRIFYTYLCTKDFGNDF